MTSLPVAETEMDKQKTVLKIQPTSEYFTVVCLDAWPLNKSEAGVGWSYFVRNFPDFATSMMLFSWY